MTRRARPRGRGTDRGAAAVEFALVLPVVLLLLFGLIQYGLYFWAMQGGSDIARDAARRAAVGDAATCADFRAAVNAQVAELTGGTADVSRRTYSSPDNVVTPVTVGDRVVVRVEFDSFDLQVPFLPFIDDGRVTAQASARVDYVPAQPQACP